MKKSILFTLSLFFLCIATLLVIWSVLPPAKLISLFDAHVASPAELIALPLYVAIIPVVWWRRPFGGSTKRQIIFSIMVTIVAVMAVVKQLDLHQAVLHHIYPQYVNEEGKLIAGNFFKPNGQTLTGTPFKARVLTNAAVPLAMKGIIVAYFVLFFGFFAFGFAFLFKRWVKGVFTFDDASWAWGCFGLSGILVQVSDRIPSWLNHSFGLQKLTVDGATKAQALCTCLEEGAEIMIPIFAILTMYYASRKALKA